MRFACFLAPLFAVAACTNPGAEPPPGKIYFPTAITLAGDQLLVVSSNFDVRYNAGSLQSYDLSDLDDAIDACDAPADGSPCVLEDTAPFLTDEVLIDSYTSAISFVPDATGAAGRAFLTVRSAGGLTFVDVLADGALDCGQGQGRRCSPTSVVGIDPVGPDGLVMTTQPTAVAAGHLRDVVVDGLDETVPDVRYALVGGLDGSINLFVEDPTGTPTLRFVRRGLAGEVTSIAVQDDQIVVSNADLTSGGQKRFSAIGVVRDMSEDFYAVYVAERLDVAGFGSNANVRALAFTPHAPRGMVAVTWSPFSLLTVDLDHRNSVNNALVAESVVALAAGPSKVLVGSVGEDARSFAFVSCVDAREIAIVDLELQRLVSVIQGVTGPFALALDSERARLFVGDFQSSTIRVVDLSPLVASVAPEDVDGEPPTARVIAIVGRPSQQRVLR